MKTDAWAFIILLAVAVSCYCIGYTHKSIRVMQEPTKIIYMVTNETDAEFNRLRKLHGEKNTIIMKQEWAYYDKNGKRCILK